MLRRRTAFAVVFVIDILFCLTTTTATRRHLRRHVLPQTLNALAEAKKAVAGDEDECIEPDDLKNQIINSLEDIEDDIDEEYDSYSMMDANLNTMDEPKICEQIPEKSADASVMRRSLCPWQWMVNFDEKREPKFISEAKCLCRKSRGLSGSYCQPIRRRFTVLKRAGCNQSTKRFEYIKSVEVITVGCHSVLPRSQRARPLSAFYNKFIELDV